MAREWDRLPDESDAAYAAFLAFRDLGSHRTVSDAFRRKTGQSTAKKATGHWNEWVRRFRWRARTRAWDAHLAERRNEAIVREHTRWAQAWHRDLENFNAMGDRFLAEAAHLLGTRPGLVDKPNYKAACELVKVALLVKTVVKEAITVDPDRLTDPQLQAIVASLGPTPTGVLPEGWLAGHAGGADGA